MKRKKIKLRKCYFGLYYKEYATDNEEEFPYAFNKFEVWPWNKIDFFNC